MPIICEEYSTVFRHSSIVFVSTTHMAKNKDRNEVIFLDDEDDGTDSKRKDSEEVVFIGTVYKKPRMKTGNTPAFVTSRTNPTVIVIDDDDEKPTPPETTTDDAAIAKALDDLEKAMNDELSMTNQLVDAIKVAEQLDINEEQEHKRAVENKISSLNIVHPELESLDPNPDIGKLFLQFDKYFFGGFLSTQPVLVKWDHNIGKDAGRFYKTANDLPTISLSADLLSLRFRRDLVETLLHEMIHCFIFLKGIVDDNDHGSVFKMHMNRINKSAGTKISIYHHFHDETAYISKLLKART